MGGFLILKRETGTDVEETERTYRSSIDIFHKKGLSLNTKVVTPEHIIYVFNKHRSVSNNIVQYDNGDFIAAPGTFFYKGKRGEPGLKELIKDFSIEKHDFFVNLLGNYCLIVRKGNRLYITNCPSGAYRCYHDKANRVVSSSFLAVLDSLKKRVLRPQEFYEYMFDGCYHGDNTLIQDVCLVDGKIIWQLSPTLSRIPISLKLEEQYVFKSFDESVEECAAQCIEYYTSIKEYYGDSVCAGLTGGMDSRLILACLRNVGIKPYLYIYDFFGSEGQDDLKIAKTITEGEGLDLEVEEKINYPVIPKDEYPDFLKRQYYMIDGLGIDGIFDNGSDLPLRYKRVEKSRLQLNGGGYQLRLFYSLPNKPTTIRSYLTAKHDGGNYSMCRGFDKNMYFSNMTQKIKKTLNVNQDKISRKQVEQLFFDWRVRYWTSINHMVNEQLADALLPGIDPQLTTIILNIPYNYMYLGIFQAAVIKRIHPNIAKYPTQKGYNFYNYNKIPVRARMREFIQYHTPIMLRPHIRRDILNKYKEGSIPYFLRKEYLDGILPSSELAISEFVDINKILDPFMLSRALSVELLLADKF